MSRWFTVPVFPFGPPCRLYCKPNQKPSFSPEVILFHDVPLERNMEKLMGVTGQIHDFNYDELPPFKQLLQPNAFCPEDAFPVAVKELKVSLFEDACRLLAGTGTQIILEFWQESEELILSVLELLKRHQLLNQIAAWGSPEKASIQAWCRRAAPQIPVLITFAQAFRVWTCWNLCFPLCGLSLGRLLPFLVEGPIVFNVPHVTDLWHNAFCKAAKVDPHTRSVKSGLIWALLCFLRRWTDTPKLFEHLFGRYKVPTILFIANTEVAIETCLSYKGVIAIQTDFPKNFYDVFNRD